MSKRRLVLAAIVSAGVGVAVFLLVPKPLPELSRQELLSEALAGDVHEVTFVDNQVITGTSSSRGPFRVVLPRGDTSLVDELRARGVKVKFETSLPSLI